MPRLSQEEINAFLGEAGDCKLACLEADGSPYIVPVTYIYRDGGFYIAGRERAAWAGYLRRDGRVSLSIEQGDRRVQVKGVAELIEGPVTGEGKLDALWRERGANWEGARLEYFLNVQRYEPMYGFFVRPSKITSWQGGAWAKRYKHADW